MFRKNQEVFLSILELNMMGHGVAKCDGAVFFVQNALPGEKCRCRVIKCAKNYYVARVEEYVTQSPDRIEPPCGSWKRCGGCAFQNASYDLEKKTKRAYVAAEMKKAGFGDLAVLPVLSTGKTDHYRNKAQFPVAAGKAGPEAGFYAPRTHAVVPVRSCSIQNESFAPIVDAVLSFAATHGVIPYDEETGKGLLRHLYLRIGEKTGEIMLCLVLTEDAFPDEEEFCRMITSSFPAVKSIVFNVNDKATNVILGDRDRVVCGERKIRDTLCGRTFSLSPHAFYQVNRDAAELLYRTAFSMAGITADTTLVDLYCGVGTIGQCAAHPGQSLFGVEIVPEAVADAKENARQNGFKRASYFCGDAAALFSRIPAEARGNALLILDPPRKGVAPSLINEIGASSFKRVLYISCDPRTLARDMALFAALGFVPGPVQPVDLFPRTSHVECVTLITKR
ncbi:MAG: 23S rRNA (uracil(1939)-C(5))-methyltransferase RlmD [Clostridia bacterium]|nr:23S rRNA (uracil(1939)-C(5))-methyltransferase RlmD [Clostridia bacterium]